MANTTGGSRFLPVIVAILAVGVFLGWLATRRPADVAQVEEPGAAARAGADAPIAATVVEPQTLAQSASARELLGQTIELQSVPVSSPMGPQLFWIELPGGSPYLVKLDDAAVAAGRSVPTSGNVNIVGRVAEKNDALLEQWLQSGVLQSSDQRMQAEFGTTYLEAQRVRPAGS